MPLPKMPTRQDTKPGETTEHAREYDPDAGGWTKPVAPPAEKK